MATTAHQSARGMLRTVSCKSRLSREGVKPNGERVNQSCTGSCYYSPDEYRYQFQDRGQTQDSVWKDSVRTSLSGQEVMRAAMPSRYVHRCDPFAIAQLVLNQPHTARYLPFEQLVPLAERSRAERATEDGRQVVRVTMRFALADKGSSDYTLAVSLDPAVNYLVRRTEYVVHAPAGDYVREEVVEEFREVGPGVFFPTRVVGRYGPKGQPTDTCQMHLDDVVVNKPLPAGAFTLRYPTGAKMTDTIRNVSYRVDEQGRPITKETPLPSRSHPPPPLADAATDQPVTESEAEATSWTRWILPASLVALGLGVAVAAGRGLRKARQQWSV